jgi:hypothetical protein
MAIVFVIGAALGVALFILRWALSAVVPERSLQKMDRAISQAGKIGCLVWLGGMILLFVYVGAFYHPKE